MNPIIISTIIGVASFILTIFSATYLSQRHTDKLIEQLEKRFDARIADLKSYLDARFDSIRAEIGTVRVETSGLNQRAEKIERQLETLFKPARSGD
ncbi:MAG: hypothetical protein ACREEM_24425 [Blastocatellia bacterium]